MKISVIIALNGDETALERCINSLNNQSFKDFEIIIVSNKNTGLKSENIKEMTYEQAESKKIDSLNGEWICMVSGNDCVSPLYLEKLLRMCNENGVNASVCGVQPTDIETPVDRIGVNLMAYNCNVMTIHEFMHFSDESGMPLFGADENKLFKKELIENDSIADLLDYGTAAVIDHKCEKVAVTKEPLYFYCDIDTIEGEE